MLERVGSFDPELMRMKFQSSSGGRLVKGDTEEFIQGANFLALEKLPCVPVKVMDSIVKVFTWSTKVSWV